MITMEDLRNPTLEELAARREQSTMRAAFWRAVIGLSNWLRRRAGIA